MSVTVCDVTYHVVQDLIWRRHRSPCRISKRSKHPTDKPSAAPTHRKHTHPTRQCASAHSNQCTNQIENTHTHTHTHTHLPQSSCTSRSPPTSLSVFAMQLTTSRSLSRQSWSDARLSSSAGKGTINLERSTSPMRTLGPQMLC